MGDKKTGDPFPQLSRRALFAPAGVPTEDTKRAADALNKIVEQFSIPNPPNEGEFRKISYKDSEILIETVPFSDIFCSDDLTSSIDKSMFEFVEECDPLGAGEIAAEVSDPVKRKRGRPVAPKPWLDAGVSRMTWYRRQKGGLI